MLSNSDKKEIILLIAGVLNKNLSIGYRNCCIDFDSLFGIKLSPDAGNTAELRENGLWIPGDGGTTYTDEQARDAVSAMLNATEFSVNDALNTIALNQVPYAKITGVPSFLLSETDPIFSASAAAGINGTLISNWNAAAAAIPGIASDISALEAADISLQSNIDDNDIATAAFTGTTVKTLTLTKGDGSTVTANFNDTGLNDTLYATDGSLPSNRNVNMQGFDIVWQNSGLFRIVEGNMTVGSVFDFNNGVDFATFDASNSANIRTNSTTGVVMSVVDVPGVAVISAVEVNALGVKLTGIDEYADNSAALGAGLSAGHLYRTGDNLKIVH